MATLIAPDDIQILCGDPSDPACFGLTVGTGDPLNPAVSEVPLDSGQAPQSGLWGAGVNQGCYQTSIAAGDPPSVALANCSVLVPVPEGPVDPCLNVGGIGGALCRATGGQPLPMPPSLPTLARQVQPILFLVLGIGVVALLLAHKVGL